MAEVPELIRIANTSGPEARDAVAVLAQMGAKALPALADAIRSSSRTVAGNMGYAMLQMTDPDAVPLLIGLIREEKMGLAMTALHALGLSRAARAFEPLVEYLRHHEQREARRSLAVEALGDLGRAEAVDPLLKVLDEARTGKQLELALACVVALAKLGNHERADLAVWVLDHERDPAIRSMAAGALQHAVCVRMLVVLRSALQDRIAEVRSKAIDALFYLGTREVIEALIGLAGKRPPEVSALAVSRIDDLTGEDFDETAKPKELVRWWSEHQQQFAPAVCHRVGRPLHVEDVVVRLEEPNVFRRVIEEIRIITGESFGFVPYVPTTFQATAREEVLRRAKDWLHASAGRLAPGKLHKHGFPQDLTAATGGA